MLGMTGRNHPNARKRKGADDTIDDRETPPDVFDPLNAEFRFTLDVAAARHNSKCRRYYTLGADTLAPDPRQQSLFPEVFVGDPDALGLDGLAQPWARGEVIWCNPPFSDIAPWVYKAHNCDATVVMLLPANRTEQPWWHKHVEWCRDGRYLHHGRCETRFLAGRRCFRNRGAAITNRTSRNPPFGIVIVVWDPEAIVSQSLQPGWAAEAVKAEAEAPTRCFRVRQADVSESRARGSRKGSLARWALKNLPPIDEEDP